MFETQEIKQNKWRGGTGSVIKKLQFDDRLLRVHKVMAGRDSNVTNTNVTMT